MPAPPDAAPTAPRSGASSSARRTGAGLRWADLRTRVLSALVLAPVAFAGVWWGSWAWAGLIVAAAVVLTLEWSALFRLDPLRMPGFIAVASVVAAVLAWLITPGGGSWAMLAAGTLAACAISRGVVFGSGIPLVGLACLALLWLRADALAGRENVLFVLLAVSASDIGAYAAGRWLGGPKLAPAISPGKTWSGAVGGLLAAMLTGQAMAQLVSGAPLGRAGLVALGLAAVSQLGDLYESWVKRRTGVKDSGKLIPGHGGLLDRLDGLLTAAPAAALVAYLQGPGAFLWR